MTSSLRIILALALVATFASAANVRTEGAAPGEFTMDFDAAKALAKDKNLPILIDFTGSDWCSWCKLMNKTVFSKPEWSAYAKDKLVLVTIDFPQNESLVPAKWRERNEKLSAAYNVEGFPTYLILDSKAEREIGRLAAGRDKTPASFSAEVDAVIKQATATATKVAEAKTPAANAEGVAPGTWTTDFAAAKAYAAEHDKPLLLNFTGSDWCYWCKVMTTSVFAKDDWTKWAADKLVLVEIDFPSDKSKQSKELQATNRDLQKQFNVRGYPTFVILKPDGTTEAGRLGAGRDKTPESFIKEVNAILSPAATPEEPGTTTAATEDEILTQGAELGKWTMDLEAAKTLAGEKGLPLFLDFTGSDWCGWCKLMQKQVFSKPEWAAWAKSNLVLVTIDFPKDKSIVPEAFQERNRELQKEFAVRGYPTYVMLDPVTNEAMGKLGAGRDKTPASFIAEVEGLLMYLPNQVEKYAAGLDGEAARDYLAAFAKMETAKKDLVDAQERLSSAQKTLQDIRAGKTVEAVAEPEAKPAAAKPKVELKKAEETKKPEKKEGAKVAPPANNHAALTKGQEPGKWTMDYDGALSYAKENNKTLLLNFTGSDWCGWCKLMDKQVFAEKEWSAYAAKNLALVTIDFPNDKSIVPAKYVERNQQLKGEYGVRGFPTYVLISPDGKELGRLGAGRDKTPASFIAEVEDLLQLTPARVTAYLSTLPADQAAAYQAVVTSLQTARLAESEHSAKADRSEAGMKKMMALDADVGTAEDALRQFRADRAAASMGDKAADFLAAHTTLTDARQQLRDFLSGLPEQNDENRKRFQSIMEAIKTAQTAVDAFAK